MIRNTMPLADINTAYCLRHAFFFFQAEDGIRDYKVTGVQTCALPISPEEIRQKPLRVRLNDEERSLVDKAAEIKGCSSTSAWVRQGILRLARQVVRKEIGRASCRERV